MRISDYDEDELADILYDRKREREIDEWLAQSQANVLRQNIANLDALQKDVRTVLEHAKKSA